jgi:hypothetical protein
MPVTAEFRHRQGIETIPFAKQLARLTGKFNSAPFLAFAAGEVLYLGSTGGDGSNAKARCSNDRWDHRCAQTWRQEYFT